MPVTAGVDRYIRARCCPATGNGGVRGLSGPASSPPSSSISNPWRTPAAQAERLSCGFVPYYGSCHIAAKEEVRP